MKDIIESASKVSTPIGLAGIALVVAMFLFGLIVRSMFKSQKISPAQRDISLTIIIGVFILGIVAIVLGFNPKPPKVIDPPIATSADLKKPYIQGFLFINGKPPKENVFVQTTVSDETAVTNNIGKFDFENIDTTRLKDSITFYFNSPHLGLVATYPKSNLPTNFYLAENTEPTGSFESITAIPTANDTNHNNTAAHAVKPVVTMMLPKTYPMAITKNTIANKKLFSYYKEMASAK